MCVPYAGPGCSSPGLFVSPELYVVLHQALLCHLLEQNMGSWQTRAVPSP